MSAGRSPRCFAFVLLGALLAVLLPAHTASAAERTVQGGRLDWGVKSSFQNYVTGPVAKGSWSLSGGAGTIGESLFRFHSASGTYDPDSGALNSRFSGGVRFVGHQRAGGYELDLTISRPTVRISGGSGTLHADIRSKERGSGVVSDRKQVPVASLNLSGVDMRGGGSPIALSGVPTTLTAEGAKSFAGYYEAGAQLDPVSLSVDVKSAAPSASPTERPEDDKDEKKDKTKDKAKDGAFVDAALDWGVRRTFREYVSGPIAEGEWKLADGAKDGGALYRFPDGTGAYDAEKGELTAKFAGGVRFTGKDLDLTLEKVSVSVKKEKGTLSADGTPLVTFPAPLKAEKGLVLVEEAKTELTAEGAEFFGSMYQKGTAMDPVTLAVTLDKSAKLPALPDLGSEPTASAEPSAEAADADEDATANTASSSDDSGSPVLPLSLAAAAVIAAGAALWFVRRRRTTTSTANSKE